MRAWLALGILLLSGCAGTAPSEDTDARQQPIYTGEAPPIGMPEYDDGRTTLLATDAEFEGLFLQFQASAAEACTLIIATSSRNMNPGPYAVTMLRTEGSDWEWSMFSGGAPARIQGALADSNDVPIIGGGRSNKLTIPVTEEPTWVTVARHSPYPTSHDWVRGHSILIEHNCEDDLNITDLRGSTAAIVTNDERMDATAQASTASIAAHYSAAIGATATLTSKGPTVVIAAAGPATTIDATLEHPDGRTDVPFAPDAGPFLLEGGAGEYTFTMDKTDADTEKNPMFLIMSEAPALDSFGDLIA